MNPNPSQIGAWMVAVFGRLTAAGLGILQAFQNRQQRKKELCWKQAEWGKRLIDEIFEDRFSNSATLMLDSWHRQYQIPGKEKIKVKIAWKEDVVPALKTKSFNQEDVKVDFIRDSFDTLFHLLDRIEHLILANLTTFEDVCIPIQALRRRLLVGDICSL